MIAPAAHVPSINGCRWLEHDKLTRYPNARITLLRPSMCFMLVQTPDPLTLKDALPPLDHITHVFLPVNDCRSPNLAEGGSHWSLLLVSIRDGVAFHYDSLRPSNYEPARIASEKFSRLCGKTLRFVNLDDAPQQNNGSDCGMYVCLEMQFLLKRLLQGGSGEKFSMSMGQNDVDAPRGRKDMLKLIEGFRKKGQRSQSRSRSPAGFGHHHGHLHASGVSEHKTDPPRVGD